MTEAVLEGIVKGTPRIVFRSEYSKFHLEIPFEFKAAYYTEDVAESDFVIGLSDLKQGLSEIEVSLDGFDYTLIGNGSLVRAEVEILNNPEAYISALHFFMIREGKESRVLSYYES